VRNLQQVGSVDAFDQEKLFIFHSMPTELQGHKWLRNQPQVGGGAAFYQEEVFIFCSTLKELQVRS
jgi:hypothetical protein